MSKESVSSPFSVSDEVAVLEGILVGGQAENSNLCPLPVPVSLTKAFFATASHQLFLPSSWPESHDLLENERTTVSDVAGSACAETAFSLDLLAELAVTADSMYKFNIESKAVRVCQSVTTSYWLCWILGR